jgi:hypothetical protein
MIQSTYLSGFLRHDKLRKYVDQGVLRLVLWNSTSECVGHPKCRQTLQYCHSILAHWGSNVRLSIADHDEYFVLPDPNHFSNIQVHKKCRVALGKIA